MTAVDVEVPGSTGMARGCPFDPPQAYLRLADEQAVGRIDLGARTGWLFTRYADVVAVLTHPALSSAVNSAPPMPDGSMRPGWFFGLDGERALHYRQLMTGAFSLTAARRHGERIAQIAGTCVDAMVAEGSSADLWSAYAWPLPGLIVCDLLGIPLADQAGFERDVAAFDADEDLDDDQRTAMWESLWTAMRDLAKARRAEPRDDLVSALVRGTGEQAVSDDEVASIALALRFAGQAPVAHVLAMGVFKILQDPRLQDAVADPGRRDALVEELLRVMPTNNLGVVRRVEQPTMIAGAALAEGDLVFVHLPVANRDRDRFPAGGDLDLEQGSAAHLAFGHGLHKCLGQNLARVQVQVALRVLFERLPHLRLDVPAADVPLFESPTSFGVAQLPVRWSPV